MNTLYVRDWSGETILVSIDKDGDLNLDDLGGEFISVRSDDIKELTEWLMTELLKRKVAEKS